MPVLQAPVLTWGPLVVLTAVSLAGFVAFSIRAALRGVEPTARVQQLGGSIVLGKYLLEYGYWMFSPLARAAVRLNVHPDVFTWSSLALHVLAGLLFAEGAFGLGGWALVLGASCDALDGLVARARHIASDAGEVLDAAVDRWAEMAAFFGLAWYYRASWWSYLLVATACAGAFMVSYARALGEARGIEAKMGLMQRHERATWLAAAAILSGLWQLCAPAAGTLHLPVLGALGAIAVLAHWTAWRRIRHVLRRIPRLDRGADR